MKLALAAVALPFVLVGCATAPTPDAHAGHQSPAGASTACPMDSMMKPMPESMKPMHDGMAKMDCKAAKPAAP